MPICSAPSPASPSCLRQLSRRRAADGAAGDAQDLRRQIGGREPGGRHVFRTIRSTTFFSSRMLPGQRYAISASIASPVISVSGTLCVWLNC